MTSPDSPAHSVVRAASWSDGGAEFIYGDGTILSFMDDMNTFVAVRSNSSAGPSRVHTNTQRRRSSAAHVESDCSATHGCVTDDNDDDDEAQREMCFTAWTLSAYEAKVRAALAVYNSLAERPRLFSSLLSDQQQHLFERPTALPLTLPCFTGSRSTLSSCGPWFFDEQNHCGVWCAPGPPIQTLLLEKRRDLFSRRIVYGAVREWLVTPTTLPPSNNTAALSEGIPNNTTTFCIYDVPSEIEAAEEKENTQAVTHANNSSSGRHDGWHEKRRTSPPSSSHQLPNEVPVGTVLELWCALRRVRLTVAVHRETFTVCWPAPVTRPDGSRLPSGSWHARDSTAAAATSPPPVGSAVLFTYLEQTFPVRSPPPAWRVMLQMALEMDAEMPDSDAVVDAGNTYGPLHSPRSGLDVSDKDSMEVEPHLSTVSQWKPHMRFFAPGEKLNDSDRCPPKEEKERRGEEGEGWLGELPDPHHWGGLLNHHCTTDHCRFSSLTATQATHLVAPRTSRVLDTMRNLHNSASEGPAAARLCWMYEASRCSASGYAGEAGGSPPAVYWCLPTLPDSAATAAALPPGARTEELHPTGSDVLAWVAEDGSVAHVCLEDQGYTVVHRRVAAAVARPAMYRLSAEGVALAQHRLPPTVASLRCRVCLSLEVTADAADADRQPDLARPVDAARSPVSGEKAIIAMAMVDPLTLHCMPSTGGGEVAIAAAASGACPVLMSLTDWTPARPVLLHPSPAALSAEAEREVRQLRCGRYLPSVADVAVQLSQLSCSVSRAAMQAAFHHASPPVQGNRLASYCAPALLSKGPASNSTDFPCSSIAYGPQRSSCAAHTEKDCIVYLTSHLDGIGTFTALTNGTMRGHFADRTLLTLIPGANELDESQLLATCVLRNGQRCTIRAAQCRPGHPIFRYLAYLLPFRRFVYLQAMQPSSPLPQPQPHCDGGQTYRATPEVVVSSIGSPSLTEDSLCRVPSPQTNVDAASSFCEVDARTVNQSHAALHGAVGVRSRVRPTPPTHWGIVDGVRTLQSLRNEAAAEVCEREERLREMLAENDALSRATWALLRD
jgi:hypothetical protein